MNRPKRIITFLIALVMTFAVMLCTSMIITSSANKKVVQETIKLNILEVSKG